MHRGTHQEFQHPLTVQNERTSTSSPKKRRMVMYLVEVALSLIVVSSLFWVAFAYKPVVKVKEIERFPFERRDFFYSATALNQGQTLCAVGTYGKIIRSDDGGATWRILPSPTGAHLQKVLAWGPDTLLAIGDKNSILLTRDGGKSWQNIEAPSYPYGEQLLSGAIVPETGTAYLVGAMGTVLRSTDRGESWEMIHPQEDLSWNDIAVQADGQIWIAGEFGNVKVSRDAGQSWEAVSVPTESSLNAIAFSDDLHGVMAGLSGTILRTADGGQTWTAVESGIQTHLYDLLWDGQSFKATGDSAMILTGTPTGEKWSVNKLGAQNFAWYTAITPIGDDYFISGAGAGVFTEEGWAPFKPGSRKYSTHATQNKVASRNSD